jgi:hypothetical protein
MRKKRTAVEKEDDKDGQSNRKGRDQRSTKDYETVGKRQ